VYVSSLSVSFPKLFPRRRNDIYIEIEKALVHKCVCAYIINRQDENRREREMCVRLCVVCVCIICARVCSNKSAAEKRGFPVVGIERKEKKVTMRVKCETRGERKK
jgi:hypothetical protein